MILYEQIMKLYWFFNSNKVRGIYWRRCCLCGSFYCGIYLDHGLIVLKHLLILMVIDYITGISAAYINPNMKLDSSKCGTGALKKVVILLVIATTYRIDLIGQTMAKDV